MMDAETTITEDFIEELDLTPRASNVLVRSYLGRTVGQLRCDLQSSTVKIAGCGRGTCAELRSAVLGQNSRPNGVRPAGSDERRRTETRGRPPLPLEERIARIRAKAEQEITLLIETERERVDALARDLVQRRERLEKLNSSPRPPEAANVPNRNE
jgi:hypothetical protein